MRKSRALVSQRFDRDPIEVARYRLKRHAGSPTTCVKVLSASGVAPAVESDELARGKARFAVDQGEYVHARKQRDVLYWLVPGPAHRGEVVELSAPGTIAPYGRAHGFSGAARARSTSSRSSSSSAATRSISMATACESTARAGQ